MPSESQIGLIFQEVTAKKQTPVLAQMVAMA